MRQKTFIILFFFSLICRAQMVDFNVSGHVDNPGNAKYVYLTDAYSGNLFLVTPLINRNFKFIGTSSLNGEMYKEGCLFLDERGDITIEEFKTKIKELIWVIGRDANLKRFVLEDIQFKIADPNKIREAIIGQGGALSKLSEEKNIAIADNKFKEFILKYPDSPVSLNLIERSIRFYELPIKNEIVERWGEPMTLFDLLSDRLKQSAQGMVLKKRIENLDK